MDELDLADIEIENHLRSCLTHRKFSPSQPVLKCVKCGGKNDRAAQDYAVCTDCVETKTHENLSGISEQQHLAPSLHKKAQKSTNPKPNRKRKSSKVQ